MAPDCEERRTSLRLKNCRRKRADQEAQKNAIFNQNKKPKLEAAPPPDAEVAEVVATDPRMLESEVVVCGDQEVEQNGKSPKVKAKKKKSNGGDVAAPDGDVAAPGTTVVWSEGGEAEPGILESKVEKGEECGDLKAKITETLRVYNKHYLQCVQEEEKRCKKEEGENKKVSKSKDKKKKGGKTVVSKAKKGSKSQDNLSNDNETKRVAKRPDLKALTEMTAAKEILYPQKRYGAIPGIEVGHQFFSRAEMVATGLHGHWLFGIDYISKNRSVATKGMQYEGLKLPLAISIVISGQYEDDVDNSDDVIYTGQGGNNLLGNRRQVKHQIMKRGNLGLKLSMEQNVPVRVTRGHKHKLENNCLGKVYTYDGLYKVVKYWAETGVSGFKVYKFRLKRIDNQPPLTTSQVYYFRSHIPNTISEIRGLVCEDLAGGLENIPIPATNLVDDPPIAPTGLTYIRTLQISPSVELPPKAPGCSCQGNCSNSRTCSCREPNGGDFAYVHLNGGRLIEPKAVVFECGSNCGCGPDCINRTSQKGLRYRLEVFRTAKKGWAVRSWDFIPAGAPICEYIGILMNSQDIDTSSDTNYVFDIDCLQTMQGLDGRERRLGDVSLPLHLQIGDHNAGPEFCIDALSTGNIARFINHSCQPNLFVQCVLSDHHDIRQARVLLFAADNIPPLTELSYDYCYALDSVVGPDGNIKQMMCYCGAPNCRKRMF